MPEIRVYFAAPYAEKPRCIQWRQFLHSFHNEFHVTSRWLNIVETHHDELNLEQQYQGAENNFINVDAAHVIVYYAPRESI